MLRKFWIVLSIIVILSLSLTACLPASSDWTRRDMPTDGLTRVVTYNLRGPAGTDREVNRAALRGVNENAPTLMQETIFDRVSGSKTQDVQIVLPDGSVYQALGMIKTKRFAGLTRYLSLEIATYSGVDFSGKAVCGAKIRLQFNRNFIQYADTEKRDWDSLWYYDIPCAKSGDGFRLFLEKSVLRAVVLNEVWQFRIAAGSFFFNWGHSVTSIGGPAAQLPGGWWLHWDLPDTINDTIGAAQIVNAMVQDLESSAAPWVEYKFDGIFKDAYLIYSAGDADRYATWERFFLNRQREYAVLYRPNREAAWDWVIVKPVYNYEWNDVQQQLAALRGWNKTDPMHDHLDKAGMPVSVNDPVVKELERIGWMNAPNASLEQIQIIGKDGNVLYAMTVRAFIGASDTLVMFGPAAPPRLADAQSIVPPGESLPMPVLYDDRGNPLPPNDQDYTPEQWARWQAESTMWNFWRDNPNAIGAEMSMQFRFADNTTWAPEYCTDSDGDRYVCGYYPVEWDLSTAYYFDNGDIRKAWLILQLLGEVGVRTLGLSYASGLYEGTGVLFAMAQIVHYDEFFAGYQPESIWTFDARASQLPDRLAQAWSFLKNR